MDGSKSGEPIGQIWPYGINQQASRQSGAKKSAAAKFEFTQFYEKNRRVIKRCVNASPAMVRRLSMDADSFQTYVARISKDTAFTAFHFHPLYPEDKREALMTANRDGLEVLMRRGQAWQMHRSGSFAADTARDLVLGLAQNLKLGRLWGAGHTAD